MTSPDLAEDDGWNTRYLICFSILGLVSILYTAGVYAALALRRVVLKRRGGRNGLVLMICWISGIFGPAVVFHPKSHILLLVRYGHYQVSK